MYLFLKVPDCRAQNTLQDYYRVGIGKMSYKAYLKKHVEQTVSCLLLLQNAKHIEMFTASVVIGSYLL